MWRHKFETGAIYLSRIKHQFRAPWKTGSSTNMMRISCSSCCIIQYKTCLPRHSTFLCPIDSFGQKRNFDSNFQCFINWASLHSWISYQDRTRCPRPAQCLLLAAKWSSRLLPTTNGEKCRHRHLNNRLSTPEFWVKNFFPRGSSSSSSYKQIDTVNSARYNTINC